MHETPLEAWLQSQGITREAGLAICEKAHCAGAYTTLMQHDFTLPTMALQVAKALDIPAQIAAPMGRPLDRKGWGNGSGTDRQHPLNHDPKWFNKLKDAEEALTEEPTHLNVVLLHRLLASRGIDHEQWTKRSSVHSHWMGSRNLHNGDEVRLWHIGKLCNLLGVETADMLTTIRNYADQVKAYGDGSALPLPREAAPRPPLPKPSQKQAAMTVQSQKSAAEPEKAKPEKAPAPKLVKPKEPEAPKQKKHGKQERTGCLPHDEAIYVIDGQAVADISRALPKSSAEMGRRYREIIGSKTVSNQKRDGLYWRNILRDLKTSASIAHSKRVTEALAETLGVPLETIARRITPEEYKQLLGQ